MATADLSGLVPVVVHMATPVPPELDLLTCLVAAVAPGDRLRHVARLPGRSAMFGRWPQWVPAEVRDRLAADQITQPWCHQELAAELIHQHLDVALATGTASGKSVGFWVPVLSMLVAPQPEVLGPVPTRVTQAPGGVGPTALYLAPTKALAADQAMKLARWDIPGVISATLDGDAALSSRDAARLRANLLLSNPDMVHRTLLPQHRRWSRWWAGLRVIVVDESHAYNGTFGAHMASLLRRMLRVAAQHGAAPSIVCCSATTGDPGAAVERLTGRRAVVVSDDGSPRGERVVAMWQAPPVSPAGGVFGEAARMLAALVSSGARTLAFVPSRAGAETVADLARAELAASAPELVPRVAAYRGGYVADERRAIEGDLQRGALLGVASTSALELGVDICGLDAVLLVGWPGSRAAWWQRAGRAGRAGMPALVVQLAGADPLEQHLLEHPELVLHAPVESPVLDPANTWIQVQHLAAAAAELPLREGEPWLAELGVMQALEELVMTGLVRRRKGGWFWSARVQAGAVVDLRGKGESPTRIVEADTGSLLGTVDADSADRTVHGGARYRHQGRVFEVVDYLPARQVALVLPSADRFSTVPRTTNRVHVGKVIKQRALPGGSVLLTEVETTSRLSSFLTMDAAGQRLGQTALEMPTRRTHSRAVVLRWPPSPLAPDGLGSTSPSIAGLHAVEHLLVGLAPLHVPAEQRDLGGVHRAATKRRIDAEVVVHDCHSGGAGFADRLFDQLEAWLISAWQVAAGCSCELGCPTCVYSAGCSAGNRALDRHAAAGLLRRLAQGARW